MDAIVLQPASTRLVRELVAQVARELDWPVDWLNDGAKGFIMGVSDGGVIYAAPGIVVRRPVPAQMLAMKLAAWRDDVDIRDALRLLRELIGDCSDNQEVCWAMVEPYVVSSQALKARYAFLDLWESIYDND
ncbi:MAG TPA: hypothetical protein DEP84_06895 [Chloroflexi bacterium]|nr:hypothetical protein [Chloroflexota bacterium]